MRIAGPSQSTLTKDRPVTQNQSQALGAKLHEVVRINHTRTIEMPAIVHELAHRFAGTVRLLPDTCLSLLWERLDADLNAAMNAVVENRRAQRELQEAEARYTLAQERAHAARDIALAHTHKLLGVDFPVVL